MIGPLIAARHPGVRRDDGGRTVARDFEALFIAQMLRAAHAARLADDPMAGNDTSFRDMQDQLMAKTIAAQSPLGVAKLLAARK